MHRTSWIRSSLLAGVLGVALAAPAGAATPDAWITTKTKLALLTTEGVSGTAIKVDTVVGRVTLHGKVGSTEEKTKAETIAQKIDGVKSVHNLLQVVSPQHEQAVQVSDDALQQRIEKALQADPSLKSSHISVQSVNKGVVLLGGTAKTLSAHLRAIEVVAIIPACAGSPVRSRVRRPWPMRRSGARPRRHRPVRSTACGIRPAISGSPRPSRCACWPTARRRRSISMWIPGRES